MKIQKFEEIIAWQKAQELAVRIYRKFSELEDKTFKSQICRAAISISNNIAEGFDRKSDKEFSYFLYIGLGSNSEVKSMVYLANKLVARNLSNVVVSGGYLASWLGAKRENSGTM